MDLGVAALVAEAVRVGAAAPVAAEVYGMRVSREHRPERAAEGQVAEVGPEEVRVVVQARAPAEGRARADPEAEMAAPAAVARAAVDPVEVDQEAAREGAGSAEDLLPDLEAVEVLAAAPA